LRWGRSGARHNEVGYTAAGGLYQGAVTITLNVEASLPTGSAEEITFPKTEYEIPSGRQYRLALADVGVAEWLHTGRHTAFKEFWNAEGDRGSVEEDWPEENVRA
jgi:hypothetical protein